jgi:hypothetical protein
MSEDPTPAPPTQPGSEEENHEILWRVGGLLGAISRATGFEALLRGYRQATVSPHEQRERSRSEMISGFLRGFVQSMPLLMQALFRSRIDSATDAAMSAAMSAAQVARAVAPSEDGAPSDGGPRNPGLRVVPGVDGPGDDSA